MVSLAYAVVGLIVVGLTVNAMDAFWGCSICHSYWHALMAALALIGAYAIELATREGLFKVKA
jgi:hypothetical protein